MTMSISCAPALTASSVSATLIEVKLWPEGNAVATDAMRTVLALSCSTQSAMRSGYTHTAATDGIVGSPALGRIALAHIAATLPGVSAPSSVVRSMHRTARSSAQSLEDFLIERLASEAARSSAPTSSTLRTPRISEPRWVRESAVAIDAIMRRRPESYSFMVAVLIAEVGAGDRFVGRRGRHLQVGRECGPTVFRLAEEVVGRLAGRVVASVVPGQHYVLSDRVDSEPLVELVVQNGRIVNPFRRRPARAVVGVGDENAHTARGCRVGP